MGADKDVSLAVLQAAVGLAGILLVFSGFLFSKAASFDSKRGDKFKTLGRWTLAPVLISLAMAAVSIEAVEGVPWAVESLLDLLRFTLFATGLFAVIGIFSL